ncbi:MAG: ABC transporter ATP-binding protein [Mycobacterium sp.]
MTPSAVAQCVAVSRTFGSGDTAVRAVRDVSCLIPPDSRIALTGSSGSGKSSLLHLIAGLDQPTEGSVSWPSLGNIRDGSPNGIGVVFQGPSLLPSLDVSENVALPLLFGGQDDGTAMAESLAALDLVGIGDLAAKLPDELSGGQSQRVAIARVLAVRPTLILADEPTGKLDHHNAQRVISVLLDAATAIGAAVVVATHDPAVADQLREHWTMRDGQLTTTTTDRGTT